MQPIWLDAWPERVPRKLDYPTAPLPAYIKRNARRAAEKAAIIYYGREISYGELDDLVDRCAAAFVALGVQKGDRISLFLENCPQFAVAYLAALRCGAILVPGNPMFKEAELEHELNDSGAAVIVCLDHLYPIVQAVRERTPLRHVVVTSFADFLPAKPSIAPHPSMLAPKQRFPNTLDMMDLIAAHQNPPDVPIDLKGDLCLLQYTSGTTGMPKGAMLTHANLLANVAGAAAWMSATPSDTVLAILPFFHVTGMVHSLDMPLFSGATVLVMSRFELEPLIKAIDRFKVNVWTSIATMNVAVVNFPDIGKYDLSSLRACLSGGAPIPLEILRRWRELTGASLVEGYGLSETIAQVSVNPLDRPKLGSVGIPQFDVDVKVVDLADWHKELPLGEEGELIVKGPMVMRGYWQRPEATAEVMDGDWFATGDIARIDEEGYIFIVGRKKELIKASGYSVFPAEVEAFLYEHPAVLEVGVVGIPDSYRGENIKAFIVLRPDCEGRVTPDEIIAWARERMAAYKYPRLVEFRSSLPKTASGKILRRLLAQ